MAEDDGTRNAVASPSDRIFSNPRTWVNELGTQYYDYRDVWADLRDPEKRVINGRDIPFKPKSEDLAEGSHYWGKSYVRPWKGITQSLSMHQVMLAPEGKSHKHSHQNEAIMYVLEGEGYERHDGVEYQWSAGDLVVIHGGCVHRHYSADPENPCSALIVKPSAMYWFLHLLYMGQIEGAPSEPARFPDWTPPGNYTTDEVEENYSAADTQPSATDD